MRLIAVGRLRAGAEADLFQRYAIRLRPKLDVIEVSEARGSPAEIKRREADRLLAAAPVRAWLMALDQGGVQMDSRRFAHNLADARDQGRDVCFVIGGAEGLDRSVLERADLRLSLGLSIWPHQLVRVMLAEQIYRAQMIEAGHPYHRN